MSFVFDPKVFLHWDLFQKESPGSSDRSLLKSLEHFLHKRERYVQPDCLKFYVTLIVYIYQTLLGSVALKFWKLGMCLHLILNIILEVVISN